MSVIRFGLTLALVIAGSQAAAAESVYTKLVFDDCVTLSTDLQGGRLHCPGYKGYGITFEEGDLRQAVRFGHVGNDELFESFGVFNRINDTIEWRLDDNGVPRAAILRWFLENPDLQTGEVTPANDRAGAGRLASGPAGRRAGLCRRLCRRQGERKRQCDRPGGGRRARRQFRLWFRRAGVSRGTRAAGDGSDAGDALEPLQKTKRSWLRGMAA